MLTRAARTRNLARKRSRRKIAVRRRQRSSQPRTVARLLLPRSRLTSCSPGQGRTEGREEEEIQQEVSSLPQSIQEHSRNSRRKKGCSQEGTLFAIIYVLPFCAMSCKYV